MIPYHHTISHHTSHAILPYHHTKPYHTIPPCHTIPRHTTIPSHTIPCHTIPLNHTKPYHHTMPYHTIPPYQAIPYHHTIPPYYTYYIILYYTYRYFIRNLWMISTSSLKELLIWTEDLPPLCAKGLMTAQEQKLLWRYATNLEHSNTYSAARQCK